MKAKNKRTHLAKTKLKTSPNLSVNPVVMLVATFIWLMIIAIYTGEMDYQSTRLILQSAGCSYLQQQGIPTQPYSIPNTCVITTPFRSGKFGQGGMMTQSGSEIRLADSQIVAVETLAVQPWTDRQIKAIYMLCISTLILIGILIWGFASSKNIESTE
jgi:hypothetical protein